MSIFSIFEIFRRKKSASLAKERLRMVLSYERRDLPTNFTDMLQKDLIQVFEKYPQFNLSNIEINVNEGIKRDELSISIPFVDHGHG